MRDRFFSGGKLAGILTEAAVTVPGLDALAKRVLAEWQHGTLILQDPGIDPPAFLAGASLYPRILSRTRENGEILCALGLTPLPRDRDARAGAPGPVFQGWAFPGQGELRNEWAGFPEHFAGTPMLLLRWGGGEKDHTCMLEVRASRSEDARRIAAELEHLAVHADPYASASPTGSWAAPTACTVPHEDADSCPRQDPDRELYKQAFRKIKQFIGQDPQRKAVLGRRTTFRICCSLEQMVRQMMTAPRDHSLYLYAPAEHACYCGMTPERLFRRQGNRIWTEAVAGTADVSDPVLAGKLLQSTKNNLENRIVRDWITVILARRCRSVTASGPEKIRYGSLVHICRKIEGVLQGCPDDGDLVAALHPTPALAGEPREEALAVIRDAENFHRGWYGGIFGCQEEGVSEYCVMIRGMLTREDKAYIYTGGGIVRDSDAEEEWQELNSKLKCIQDSFDPEGILFTGRENRS